jgi:hypothetical protein
MIASEVDKLPLPLVPELREAVEEYDERTFARADVVELNAIYLCVMIVELYRVRLRLQYSRGYADYQPNTSKTNGHHWQGYQE